MAGKTGSTALQTAIQGGKVSDKAARSALGEAVGRIANLTKKANTSKEAMMETGTLVLHTAETQGSLFLASMAEGYLGEDRMKLGSVDLRAPVGLLAQGYGLYQTMTGQKGAGQHVLAVGNGVMGSWLANVARNAGRTLAEKRAGAAQPQALATTQAPAPAIVMQGTPMLPGPSLLPEPGLAGPMREVLLTPESGSDPAAGWARATPEGGGATRSVAAGPADNELGWRFGPRRGRGRRRGPAPRGGGGGGRFVRAATDEDDTDDES